MSTTLNEYIDENDEEYRLDTEIKNGGARLFVYKNSTQEGIKFYLKKEDAEQFACDLLAAIQ